MKGNMDYMKKLCKSLLSSVDDSVLGVGNNKSPITLKGGRLGTWGYLIILWQPSNSLPYFVEYGDGCGSAIWN